MPLTDEVKRAALIGLRHHRDQLDTKITELERELRSNGQPAPQKKRPMSAAGRKRIADAQRKRWAARHAEQKGAGVKRLAKKRASGRKAVS